MHREMRSPAAPLELKERRQAGGIGSAAAHASARGQDDSELSVAGRLQFSDVVDVDDRRSMNADERRRIDALRDLRQGFAHSHRTVFYTAIASPETSNR